MVEGLFAEVEPPIYNGYNGRSWQVRPLVVCQVDGGIIWHTNIVKSQILNGTGTPQGTNISPSKGTFEDVVPFLQVRYLSSLEGTFSNKHSIDFYDTLVGNSRYIYHVSYMIHGSVPMTGPPQHIIDSRHSFDDCIQGKKGKQTSKPFAKPDFWGGFPKIVVESGGNIANCRAVFPEKNDPWLSVLLSRVCIAKAPGMNFQRWIIDRNLKCFYSSIV